MLLEDPRVISILCPAQHLLDGAGAAAVFRLQIAAVRAAGLSPSLVVLAPRLLALRRLDLEKGNAIRKAAAAMGADVGAIVGNDWGPRTWLALARTAVRIGARAHFGPEDDLDLDTLTATSLIEGPRPGAVLCNYLSGLGAADALAPRTRQLVVLHDLPDRSPSERFRRALVNRPNLMSLSGAEAHRLAALVPDATLHLGLPFECHAATRHVQAVQDGTGPGSTNLLFVGGLHGPNIEGMTSFIKDCFRPHLAPAGVTLAIAGRVCQALTRFHGTPGLTLLGHVEDLAPLYRAATLVIVPLLTGTGISLKTLEALAENRPVLSTPAGLRGLGMTEAAGLAPPFDGRWTRAVMELVRSGDARVVLRDRLKADLQGPSLGQSLGHILPALVEGRTVAPLPRRPLFSR